MSRKDSRNVQNADDFVEVHDSLKAFVRSGEYQQTHISAQPQSPGLIKTPQWFPVSLLTTRRQSVLSVSSQVHLLLAPGSLTGSWAVEF